MSNYEIVTGSDGLRRLFDPTTNKTAVIVHPSFGGGWYSWNREHPQCLFSPEVALWILDESKEKEVLDLQKLFGDNFKEHSEKIWHLEVVWVDKGEDFVIHEYDGSEYVSMKRSTMWITA